jgi:rhodanese-related sulfurtransferase
MQNEALEIDVEVARQLEGLRLIDIRTADEVAQAPMLGTVEHIPMDQLVNKPEAVNPADATVLVCAAGVRSTMVAKWFRKQGLHSVYSLIGGQPAWNEFVVT